MSLQDPVPADRPQVVVFDVNETLSDLSALGARFLEVGASASAARLWFASVLRDGFALNVAGESPVFAGVARENLRVALSEASLDRTLDEAADHVMDGFARLEVHADVPAGVDRMHEAGLRLVTLSNGSAGVAERLLEDANLLDRFERLLSVEDAGAWKPSARAYEHAAEACGTSPAEMLLVAVHPWDVDGALRAGFQAAWVNRSDGPWPGTFREPTYTVDGLEELAEVLA